MEKPAIDVVDACVRPSFRGGEEIREWMAQPWRSARFPGPETYLYAFPSGEYWPGAVKGQGLPGSNPAAAQRQLFDEDKADIAVLLPRTRGLLPNVDLDSEICAATNRWLAETWLGEWNSHGRYRGSIRVAVGDPSRAVQEIWQWARHPYMVQVAVPTQSHHPYGQRGLLRIWEAAAECGLPVVIQADGGAGVDFHPTPVGYLRHAAEYSTLYPLNFAYHLASFIAEGVFERVERLKVVFADGGFSMLAPLLWRLDKDWRPNRIEMPWTKKAPTEYVRQHVRFCSNGLDGPDDAGVLDEWLEVADAKNILMFASNYPDRSYEGASQALAGVAAETRQRIMSENASDLYGLSPSDTPVGSV